MSTYVLNWWMLFLLSSHLRFTHLCYHISHCMFCLSSTWFYSHTHSPRLSFFLRYTPLILPRHCSSILRLMVIGVNIRFPLCSFSTVIFRIVQIFLAPCCHVNWLSCRLRKRVFPWRANISFTLFCFVQAKGNKKYTYCHTYCPSNNVYTVSKTVEMICY